MFCGLRSRTLSKHSDDEGTIYKHTSVSADYPKPEVRYLYETNIYYIL